MALGFNNQPVNWQKDFSGQYQTASNIGRIGDTIAGAISAYSQKAEQKKKDEQAAIFLQEYLKQSGADPSIWADKKKIKAGVESVGADAVLQMGQSIQRKQEMEADRARLAESIAIYGKESQEGASHERAAMAAGEAYMKAGGKDPQAIMEYINQLGDARYKEGRQKIEEQNAELNRLKVNADIALGKHRQRMDEIKTATDLMSTPTDLRYKNAVAASAESNVAAQDEDRELRRRKMEAEIKRINGLDAATRKKYGGADSLTSQVVSLYRSGDPMGALKASGFDSKEELEMQLEELGVLKVGPNGKYVLVNDEPALDQPGANRDDGKIVAPVGFTIRVK